MKERQSKLDAHAARLDQWFGVEKQSIEYVREQLAQDGVAVSASRLSEWWSARQSQLMQERQLSMIASGARQCKDVEKQFAENASPQMDMLMALHRVLILNLSTAATADSKLLKLVNETMYPVLQYESGRTKAELEKQKLDLAARRVKLLEEKAKAFDQAKEVVALQLSPEEQKRRLKEILK